MSSRGGSRGSRDPMDDIELAPVATKKREDTVPEDADPPSHLDAYLDSLPKLRLRSETSTGDLARVEEPFKTFEDALDRVGIFSRYQFFTCVVVQYASILWAGNYSFMTLGRLEPDWQCHDPGWNHSIHRSPVVDDPVACHMIRNCSKGNLTTLNNPFKSLVEEWNLVCDTADIPDLLFLIYLFGRIGGSIVGGHVGDAFGRKKGFFTAQFVLIITGVMAVACTNWQQFAVLQAVNGFFFGIIEVTALTLMMEYTDNKYRLIPNAMFQWCLGYMVLALIGFLTREWRLYIIMVNLVCSPLLVGYLLFVESPRWLISKGHLFRAAEALSDIASDKWNTKGVAIKEEDLVDIHRDAEPRFYWFYHLFSTKHLALQSFLQMISIFTYSLVDSTYVFNVNAVPGGPYWHFFYYGLLRAWVAPVVIVLDWKYRSFGRKALFLSSLSITGLCFLANIVLLALGFSSDSSLVIACTIIGTTINSSAFYMAIVQITTQAYPTVMRAIAFGSLHIWSDVASILSTLVTSLRESLAYPTVMRAIAFGSLHIWSDVASILSTLVTSPRESLAYPTVMRAIAFGSLHIWSDVASILSTLVTSLRESLAYPTVMRAIAFGSLHIWSDVASILSTLVTSPRESLAYPTVMRAIAFGSLHIWSDVASILSTLVTSLRESLAYPTVMRAIAFGSLHIWSDVASILSTLVTSLRESLAYPTVMRAVAFGSLHIWSDVASILSTLVTSLRESLAYPTVMRAIAFGSLHIWSDVASILSTLVTSLRESLAYPTVMRAIAFGSLHIWSDVASILSTLVTSLRESLAYPTVMRAIAFGSLHIWSDVASILSTLVTSLRESLAYPTVMRAIAFGSLHIWSDVASILSTLVTSLRESLAYPTVMRAIAFGSLHIWSDVASILSTQLREAPLGDGDCPMDLDEAAWCAAGDRAAEPFVGGVAVRHRGDVYRRHARPRLLPPAGDQGPQAPRLL